MDRETDPADSEPVDSKQHNPIASAGRPRPLADTVISLILGFIVAFTFRAFFVEPFVIPTGSMAPTLLGSHIRVETEQDSWAVDARALTSRSGGALSVHEPSTGAPVAFLRGDASLTDGRMTRPGERIMALKHAYALRDPKRWEIAIFRSPASAETNFIKRIVGLPGEQLAIFDGDVFISGGVELDWSSDSWRIARKPQRLQASLWQLVSDRRSFGSVSPWVASDGVFSKEGLSLAAGRQTITWDQTRWPLVDREPYNEIHRPSEDESLGPFPINPFYETHYPLSDLAISAELTRPLGETESISGTITTLGSAFRAQLSGGRVQLLRRESHQQDWELMGDAPFLGLAREIAIWHYDQRLSVFINGELMIDRAYDLKLADRIARSMPGNTLESLIAEQTGRLTSVFSPPDRYSMASADWTIETQSGLTLKNLSLWRDLHYRSHHNPGAPIGHPEIPLGTHPSRTASLGRGEYFMLGDNSAASADSRAWIDVHPLVSERLGPRLPGVVPRELIIGRAVFVYLPSPSPAGEQGWWLPRFDLGRTRWVH